MSFKPFLRDINPILYDQVPEYPSYESGYLVSKNAGWRNVKPVIDIDKCKGCLQCYLYCPDGVIIKDHDTGKVKIDYDFCKGCGICKKICKFAAISMIEENQ